jgi:hypothetical protein
MTVNLCQSVKNGISESHDGSDQTADEETPVPVIGDRLSKFRSSEIQVLLSLYDQVPQFNLQITNVHI